MSRPQNSNAMRYGPSYTSTSPVVVPRVCPAYCGTPLGTRSVYCKPACKKLANRLRRRTLHSTVDPAIVRKDLQRRRLLVAHTVYECSRCGERFLGERRCGDCNSYARSIGLRRQLSGLRHRHPARRSARTGGDDHVLISRAVASGDGHDAPVRTGLDNPCGGSPHDHTRILRRRAFRT
jgi:hypothetical protein